MDASDWRATLTLGAEDTHNCAAGTYAYTPLIVNDDADDDDAYSYAASLEHTRRVAIASISVPGDGDGAAIETLPLSGGNSSVTLFDSSNFPVLYVPKEVYARFASVTGAVHNASADLAYVDCARVAQLPRFRLNLGADGATPVSLHPSDYVHCDVRKKRGFFSRNGLIFFSESAFLFRFQGRGNFPLFLYWADPKVSGFFLQKNVL